MTADQKRLLQIILVWLITEWINEYGTPKLAELLRPWVEKLLSKQDDADLQHYNERFDSFKQLSSLLEHIDGHGSDPHAKHQVDVLVQDIHKMKPPVVTDTGPSEYEKQKAAEDPWA